MMSPTEIWFAYACVKYCYIAQNGDERNDKKNIYSKVNFQIKNSLKSFERIYLFLLTIIDTNFVVWLETVIIALMSIFLNESVAYILFSVWVYM